MTSPPPPAPHGPQGFSEANKLGSGGYGPVFRGLLDGVPVAVKCLDNSEGAMQARGPHAEALSRLHVHGNALPPLGPRPFKPHAPRRSRLTRLPPLLPCGPQGEAEFLQEAQILGRLHHPHIVLLIGVCPSCCMLVYEVRRASEAVSCSYARLFRCCMRVRLAPMLPTPHPTPPVCI